MKVGQGVYRHESAWEQPSFVKEAEEETGMSYEDYLTYKKLMFGFRSALVRAKNRKERKDNGGHPPRFYDNMRYFIRFMEKQDGYLNEWDIYSKYHGPKNFKKYISYAKEHNLAEFDEKIVDVVNGVGRKGHKQGYKLRWSNI